MSTCPDCGSTDVVEVDNPIRREVRHRRGVECPGPPSPELLAVLDRIEFIKRDDTSVVDFMRHLS